MWRSVGIIVSLFVCLWGCSFDRAGLPISRDSVAHSPTDLRDLPPPPVGDGPLEFGSGDASPCPPGQTHCGGACVNLSSNMAHCGGCDKACGKDADACVNGVCICGTSAGPCSGGLNCVAGSCRCVEGAGSSCDGCCEGGICFGFAAQDWKRCGAMGSQCVQCEDGNPCSSHSCQTGACSSKLLADWTPCDDGKFCFVDEVCLAGQCSGKPKSCPNLPLQCKINVCNETAQACVPQNVPNNTPCGNKKVCKNGNCVNQ